MERMFVIREWGKDDPNPGWTITETELLKRLALCIYSQDRIATLLHGTELLPWNERVVSFQINPESATVADIVRMAEELFDVWRREDILKMRGKDQPIILSRAEPVSVDKPTRKEWEMFAHNLANAIYFRADESTLTKRILSMPGVPKEGRDE